MADWTRQPESLTDLKAQGKIVAAVHNPKWINEVLVQCTKDLALAHAAHDSKNLKGALVNAYDAARNAIECHMNSQSLRVGETIGSHKTVIDYAASQLNDVVEEDDIAVLDQLRDLRNTAEYPMSRSTRVPLTDGDVTRALDVCGRIVQAVARKLVAPPPTKP